MSRLHRAGLLLDDKRETAQDVNDAVSGIIAEVRRRGDDALIEYTRRFDRHSVTRDGLAITAAEIDRAMTACPADQLAALAEAARRIGKQVKQPQNAGCMLLRRPAVAAFIEAERAASIERRTRPNRSSS